MTIDQLEMIEALVSEGSMQKAAKRLNKSQPSLSVGIKKIEEYYDLKLFSRESYRPTLTEEGKIFLRSAQEVLDSHRKLHKVATELAAKTEPKVHIVIDPIVLLSSIKKLLEKAMSFCNTTQLIFTEDVLEGPINSLIAKKAQFAIGHCPSHRSWEVIRKKIGHIDLVPVVKKGLDYKSLPNVVVAETSPSHRLQKNNKAHWYVSNHRRKEELIIGGYGWGRMSKLKQSKMKDQLAVIKSSEYESVHLEVYMMAHNELPLGKVAKQLWDMV